ncbi:MAG: hypothetical protein M3Z04_24585 [Chloroflexota bacterium]|nr:hypothetical protein [Chloroflexota bacterium]
MTLVRLKHADEIAQAFVTQTGAQAADHEAVVYAEYNEHELAETFRVLAHEWRWQTGMLSSAQTRVMHPAYQRIIGLGPAVVPLILRELAERPDHWFWALHAITEEDIAPNNTNLAEVCTAWLQWGKDRGYLV